MESVAILSPQLYASLQKYRKSRLATSKTTRVILPLQFGSSSKRCRETRDEKLNKEKRPRSGLQPSQRAPIGQRTQTYPNPMMHAARSITAPVKKYPTSELKEGAHRAMLGRCDFPSDSNQDAFGFKKERNEVYSGSSLANMNGQYTLRRDDSLSSDLSLPSEDDIDLLFDETFDATAAMRNVENDTLKSSFSFPDSTPLY